MKKQPRTTKIGPRHCRSREDLLERPATTPQHCKNAVFQQFHSSFAGFVASPFFQLSHVVCFLLFVTSHVQITLQAVVLHAETWLLQL